MTQPIAFTMPGTDILVDNRIHNYTDFQLKMIARISKFEGFEHFLTHSHSSLRIKEERQITLTWSANGRLNALRVGRNRVLGAITLVE